jgi:hypothetical protein
MSSPFGFFGSFWRLVSDVLTTTKGLSVGSLTSSGPVSGTTGTFSGAVSGGLARVEVTATGALTAQQCRGTILTNYGMSNPTDTTLYALTESAMMTVSIEEAAQTWSLKPPSGEAFKLDKTDLDADDEIDCAQAVGDFLTLKRIRTGAATWQWCAYSGPGAWTDGGGS